MQGALLELRGRFVARPYAGENYPVDFVGMGNGMEDGRSLVQDTQYKLVRERQGMVRMYGRQRQLG